MKPSNAVKRRRVAFLLRYICRLASCHDRYSNTLHSSSTSQHPIAVNMGSQVSLQNDTDDIIMVKLTANGRVLAPILAGVVVVVGGAAAVMTAGTATAFTVAGAAIT